MNFTLKTLIKYSVSNPLKSKTLVIINLYFDCLQLTYLYLVLIYMVHPIEAVARRCSVKTVLLRISQNSQENTCDRVYFLIKLQKENLTQVFFVNFAKFSRTAFFKKHLWWLLVTPHLWTAASENLFNRLQIMRTLL